MIEIYQQIDVAIVARVAASHGAEDPDVSYTAWLSGGKDPVASFF